MADSRRIKGWKNLTVKGHVSAPIIPPSILAQQRKHRAYHTPTRNGPSRRRKVEAVRLIPAQALIDNYNRRKEATARFPFKIKPRHIRTAMRRYEQILQDACVDVENSCASCGEFGSQLVTRVISQLESQPDLTFIVRSNRLRHI